MGAFNGFCLRAGFHQGPTFALFFYFFESVPGRNFADPEFFGRFVFEFRALEKRLHVRHDDVINKFRAVIFCFAFFLVRFVAHCLCFVVCRVAALDAQLKRPGAWPPALEHRKHAFDLAKRTVKPHRVWALVKAFSSLRG